MMKQNERVLGYMEQFGSITAIEAMRDLGVMRLASRISDLKRGGVKGIRKRTKRVMNRFGEETRVSEYYLERGE